MDTLMSFEKNTTVLVTGGAGFIGSNLCEYLIKANCKVICLDNLSTGNIDNVTIFESFNNYTFIKGDITDFETCNKACQGVEYVFHEAALGSVPRSIKFPLMYEENNIKGMLNMLEAAKINKVKTFVYASSSSVYGDSQSDKMNEGNEGNVLSPYALTKSVGEKYAKLYSSLYGLKTIGLRYFNVFGKRQNAVGEYAAVLPKFVKMLSQDTAPTIFGDGKQSRDFTYIENVIQANYLACLADYKYSGEVYNVACGEANELLDIYLFLNKKLNKDIKPNFTLERLGDIKNSLADLTKIKRDLGYKPKYSLYEGLDLTLQWYNEKCREG